MTQPKQSPEASAHLVSDLAGALLADVARRQADRAAGRAFGPISRFERLDSMLSGAFASGLHILHGAPGSGKTAFALGLALECGAPAVFVSCEVEPLELVRRLIARVTGLYLHRLKNGDPALGEENLRTRLAQVAQAAAGLLIVDATTNPATLATIKRAADMARSNPNAPPSDHLLIVVDSIHAWTNALPEDAAEEYDRLNAGLEDLRQLAMALKAPLIGIAERNRASAKSGGQGASAGSRRFEYASESVFELDLVDPKAKADPDGWKPVMLTVSKNRHGDLGTVPLRWHGARQRHEEVN